MSQQQTDTPVLDLLARMNTDAIETTTLDPEQAMLVRIAALVAVDAPPASYMLNLSVAGQVDVGAEEIQGVLAAIAPIVGTTKIVSASGNILRALGFVIEMGEIEAAED